MRRAACLLLLAACGDEPARPPEPPPVAPPAETQWVKTQAPGSDLEVRVPKEWTENYKVLEHELHFGGPGAPGARPELIFGWDASDWSLETYVRETFLKYERSPAHKVLRTGSTVVAGMPARWCIFETGATRQIHFIFVGHGYRGFVRGVAPAAEFGTYGPIFEEAARRVRYNAQ